MKWLKELINRKQIQYWVIPKLKKGDKILISIPHATIDQIKDFNKKLQRSIER